jgi:hypothetical protein
METKMKNKGSLIISTIITAALITIGIGVIRNANADNAQAVTAPTAVNTQSVDREQAYQQLLADANAKIALANQEIEQLVNQIPTQGAETATPYLFSPQQAAALAANIAGVSPNALPELVNFNNTPSYEAVYGNGKVYVDANSGRILYNGLQKKPANINADQAVNIATRYLNRTDVTSIDVVPFNGTSVYLVGFSDGTQVYVDVTGQIVAIQMPSQNASQSSSEEHEKDDD